MLTFRSMAAGAPIQAAAMAAYLSERDLTPDRLALADYYTEGRGPGGELRAATRQAAEQGEGGEALSDSLAAVAGRKAAKGNGSHFRADLDPRLADALAVKPGGSANDRELTLLLSGRRADGGRLAGQEREISGYDLTFSADKSVSLAHAFAPTEAERAMILQAHKDAVEAAMGYVGHEIGRARRGKDGTAGADQGEVAWLTFDHYTSRPTLELVTTDPATGKQGTELHSFKQGMPGDPNLHTHAFLFNIALTKDERAGSLDSRALNGRVHEFGAYFQAHLATNLRRIGAKVELDKATGAARLVSVPNNVRRAFSKRTNNAHEAAREWAAKQGVDWDALSDQGRADLIKRKAVHTREGKRDDLEQMEAWRAQARALRWQHRGVVGEAPQQEPLPQAERTRGAYNASQPLVADEFKRRSVIAGYDLRAMAARGLIETGITGPDDISRVTLAFREHGVDQHGRNTAILWGEDRGHRGFVRVTTQLHADQERDLIRLAASAAADRSGDLKPEAIEEAVARSGLDFSGAHGATQREAMERLATSGKMAVLIGSAGAGKTALLSPLVNAWRAEGRQVYGLAQAWRQAGALQDAGIDKDRALAMARFMHPAVTPTLHLDRNSVVLLDELGQIGAKPMLDLLELREKHGFTLVAVGDDKQCASIDAGPVIDLMRRALGGDAVPEILTTIRQTTERERETATLFREGKAAEALERKRDDGTLAFVPGGHKEAVARTAELWAERTKANAGLAGYSLTVSAPTNADAHAVSLAIREQRRGMGEIGRSLRKVEATDQTGVAKHSLELAAGDRVRLFDRVWGKDAETGRPVHAGNNGSVVTVMDADRSGLVVRTAAGREARVAWEQLTKHGNGRARIAYGDALTIDSAQGITSTEHIAAMPSGSQAVTGFKAYVAASRHRVSTFIVASDGMERREIMQRRPLGDERPMTDADVLANVGRNLGRQPEKMSSLAFLERAIEVKRTAARGLQRGARLMEIRAAQGRQPTGFRQTAQRQRDERAVEQASRQLEIVLSRLGKAAPTVPTPERPSAPIVVEQRPSAQSPARPFAPATPALSAAEIEAARKAVWNAHLNEVRSALRNNAAGIAEAVAGKPHQRGRTDWRYGAKGALKITVAGPNAGLWHDHEAGKGGDMLALIQHRHGGGFGQAVAWARERLGVPVPDFAKPLTDADRARMDARGAEMAAGKARADAAADAARLSRQETVARRAGIAWEGSKPAPADHPYLVRKGIEPHTARVDRRGRLRIAAVDPATGKVWSLQHIEGDGTKRFLKGGRMDGMAHVIGAPEPGRPVAFAEGFATAASVREATGLPVAVAFNAGNKEKVVAGWRGRNPAQTLIDAADNDIAKPKAATPGRNAGAEMAERLARDLGAVPALPPWRGHEKGSDWNDFAAAYGKAAAAEAFRAAVASHQQAREAATVSPAAIREATTEQSRGRGIER